MSSGPNPRVPSKKSFAQVAAAARNPGTTKQKTTNGPALNIHSPTSPKESSQIPTPNILNETIPGNGVEMDQQPDDEKHDTTPQMTGTELSGALQAISLTEGPPLASFSESSGKRDNSDTKSVTSRTTLALDEKESLRPDDSASTRAPLEDDALSPGGSAVAGSKPDSDPEAPAFRDQLNEIDRTGSKMILAQRNAPPLEHDTVPPINGVNDRSMQPRTDPTDLPQSPSVSLQKPPSDLLIPPDEKLIEALASPKDRLFVLKVEQDMIDFIKDSKEQYLQLPQTNSFYRMLSHKLADYYFLGHYIDDSMTSVRIHRTPYARLPPPLIGLDSIANGTTPPPSGPTRKIMKRVDTGNLGQDTSLSSPMPSKPPSENGGIGSGSEDAKDSNNQPIDKANLSREERENRYNEARARIFANFKELSEDGNSIPNEVEMSRSSSASGTKKTKKNRKPNDDGFEARSAYSQYNGQAYAINTVPQAQPPPQSFNAFSPGGPPVPLPFGYDMQGNHPGFQQMQNNWSQQAQYPYAMSPAFNGMQQNLGDGNMMYQGTYPGYQQFQSPNMPMTPNSQMFSPDQSYWGQQSFQVPFGPNVNQSTNSMPSHIPGGQLMYGMNPYDVYNSHMAYNRQQFNPMSQAFTPSMRGGAMPTGNPSFAQSPSRYPTHSSLQRPASNASQMSGFNSPSTNNRNQNSTSQSPNNPSQSQNSRAPSSISKWGTPPTLPPKPPPTATTLAFQAPRHNDSQQPLPPNPMHAGLGIHQRGQTNGTGRSQSQR